MNYYYRQLSHKIRAASAALVFSGFLNCMSAQNSNTQPSDEPVKLNPYAINEKKVVGWNSQMTFSGSRTSEDLLSTPTNITILTKDFLKDIGADSLQDALKYSGGGVTMRVGYNDDYTVRGFRQNGVIVDGVPQYDAGSIGVLYDIDRIEVIKGPQALVFSNYGNIGGQINYVTKRPTPQMAGDASFTVGSYGLYIGQVTQSGPLTPSGNVRYRVTAGAQHWDGWFGRSVPDGADTIDNQLVSAAVDWSVTKDLELRFNAVYKYNHQRDFGSAFRDPTTGRIWSGFADGFDFTPDWNYLNTEVKRFRMEAIYRPASEVTVRALVSMARQTLDFLTTQVGTNTGGLQLSEAPNFQTITGLDTQILHQQTPVTNAFLDATWIHDFRAVKSRLNVGYEYDQNNQYLTTSDVATPNILIGAPVSSRGTVPADFGAPILARSLRNGGWTGYAQEALSFLNERLLATGGVRYVSDSSNNQAKSAVVPSYGIVYKILPALSFYAGAAKSFSPQAGLDAFGTPLVNITGTSKEVGLKFNALNEHLFGTIDYFDVLVNNVLLQVQRVDPVTGQIKLGNAQVGKQSNKGLEAEVGGVFRIGDGDWSTYVSYYEADPRDQTGAQASRSAKTQYSVFTKYRFMAGDLKHFEFGGGVSYVGRSPGVGFPWQPAYRTYSGLARYTHGNWDFTVTGDNLANEKYSIVGSEGQFNIALQPPITFKGSVSYRW